MLQIQKRKLNCRSMQIFILFPPIPSSSQCRRSLLNSVWYQEIYYGRVFTVEAIIFLVVLPLEKHFLALFENSKLNQNIERSSGVGPMRKGEKEQAWISKNCRAWENCLHGLIIALLYGKVYDSFTEALCRVCIQIVIFAQRLLRIPHEVSRKHYFQLCANSLKFKKNEIIPFQQCMLAICNCYKTLLPVITKSFFGSE